MTTQQGEIQAATDNWQNAHDECIGPSDSANWMVDLISDGMEIHVSPDRSLVLVDRVPTSVTSKGEAMLHAGPIGIAGSHLTLQGQIKAVDDTVLHGFYTGTLSSIPVVMDQFVEERNGVPITLVYVIRRGDGVSPASEFQDTSFILSLLKQRGANMREKK